MREGNVDEHVLYLDQGYGYRDGDIIKYHGALDFSAYLNTLMCAY